MANHVPLGARAREAVLDWYASHGRRLPFRETRDPYAILVSEAMAQQTQAARAGEAWTRFMGTYPTAAALAAATPGDVLRAWHGLGYNRRALHLWRAAKRIVEAHGGQVPADLRALESLPGVGPYTARAVAALAFGMPVGAVDTNVRRVLGRMVAGSAGAMGPAEFQRLADAVVPADRAGAWTHALMDLGATLCRPRTPDCAPCPARPWCRFAAEATRKAGTAEASEPAGTARKAPQRFVETTRWLRGRIVDRLRASNGEAWTRITGPIGGHDEPAVAAALEGLARDGIIELEDEGIVEPDRATPDGDDRQSAGRRARLSLS